MKNKLKDIVKRIPLKILSPIAYEKLRFFIGNKYPLHLQNPRTFNEKISYRKLFDQNEKFIELADKFAVREYVHSKIGQEILSRVYYFGNGSDLNVKTLPNKFVAKANNASGSEYILIIDDKKNIGEHQLLQKMVALPRNDYGITTNEWWYEKIKPNFLIEEFLTESGYEKPIDYKIYVFHGKAEFIYRMHWEGVRHFKTFYDREWNKLDITKKNIQPGPPVPKPKQLPRLLSIADELGQGLGFVRVDLYNLNDERVVFGELTLAPAAGFDPFKPRIWDLKFGEMWHYPD